MRKKSKDENILTVKMRSFANKLMNQITVCNYFSVYCHYHYGLAPTVRIYFCKVFKWPRKHKHKLL